jgi:DNA repair exonuclease SbcCD ATPase subunit
MIKKLIFWSVVVGAGLFVINHVRPGSVHTAIKRAQAKFEKKISPEFELARIRDQIAELTPDMIKNVSKIAGEMVAVQTLERRVDDLQGKLAKGKFELKALTDAVEQGTTTRVSINGKEYAVTSVNEKLRNCRNLERELANTQKILDAKRSGVEAARQQLAEMKNQKAELEVMAADYEAQLKTLALEQTRAKIKLDDSRLAEIKASFERLRVKIDTARTTAQLAEEFNNGTLTEKKAAPAKDVVAEAREYLGTTDTVQK